MTTLAPKLPYSHPFAGGYPRLGGQALPTDPDAIDYLARVAAADGAAVEVGVAMAVDAFVKGCKADGIWDAIKASCILCGARTLSGALVSLRQYGPELWDNSASPTVADRDGSAGSYDIATRTMSNLSVGTNSSYPRFQFSTIGVTTGVTYAVSGQLAGDLSLVNNVRLGSGSTLTFDQSTGVISGTATASQALLEFLVDGTFAPSSVRIESLSIKEVINDTENVANNFTGDDYDRTTGLKGDGSTTYLDTNRANDADGLDDNHQSVFLSSVDTRYASPIGMAYIGASNAANTSRVGIGPYANALYVTNMCGSQSISGASASAVGFVGSSRASSSGYSVRSGGSDFSKSVSSVSPAGENHFVFADNAAGSPASITNARLAFYSIGSAIPNLAALDNRVSTLISSISAALS